GLQTVTEGKERPPTWVKSQVVGEPRAMSALPPKADMCGALAHVCFVPLADIAGIIRSARVTTGDW
ncbi:MAG: hypothetical protein WCD59_06650, partial [Pseudolabrys sp.]